MSESKTSVRPFVPCGSFGTKKTAAMNAARSLTKDRDPEIWTAIEREPGRWAILRVS